MATITLILNSEQGDVFGRFPLENIELAGLGESAGRHVARELDCQMSDICSQIRECVALEGLTIYQGEIDLRIAVSKALMNAGEDGAEIHVPVKEAPTTVADTSADGDRIVDQDPGDLRVTDWDALLAVNEEGGTSHV